MNKVKAVYSLALSRFLMADWYPFDLTVIFARENGREIVYSRFALVTLLQII